MLQSNLLILERVRIAANAAATRLPTVYGYREHVEAGGLISYGVNLDYCFRRAATYVHKILKGTPVADLPVEFGAHRNDPTERDTAATREQVGQRLPVTGDLGEVR